MPKKRDREFWETTRMNNATFVQYYNRLMELSMSMFDWKNLPDSVDARFLELALFTDGHAVYFKDEVMGDLALRAALSGPFDVYRVPNNRRAYAANSYNKQLTNEDSVIIYNNLLRTNSMLDVEMFARRLYDLDRSVDVNARAQKTPVLIQCDENMRLSLVNMYRQYDGNAPVIFGTNGLNKESLTVLNTGAPFVADKLYQLKTQIWNEALTYLGIANINVQKKERLITDEVMRNQGGVVASRYSRLEARRQACNKINKMFGLQIECDYREDFNAIDLSMPDTSEEGDEEDG